MNLLDFIHETRKNFIGNLVAITVGIGTFVLVAVVVSIMLGYLGSINTSYLGNNTNATAAINTGFTLIQLVLGLAILIIAVALLWLVVSMVSGGGLGGAPSGGKRGRRGR